jgi:hypothetical protein
VQVTVCPDIPQVQPVPLAALGVNPVGSESVTVTTVPFVPVPPLLVTVKVKLPVAPRANVDALAVLEMFRSGPVTVPTVTEPVAGVVSPPPLTVAEFINDAGAFEAMLTDTEMAG